MDETFTIDELAARTGVASRTIRQYQTAGLVSPPERRGRVGIYGLEHVERLAAIARLQARGYSLAGMRDLFNSWERGRPLTQIIGGPTTQPDVPVDESPLLVNEAKLLVMLPALTTAKRRSAAIRAGLIMRATGNTPGGWIVPSPSAIAIVADLIDAGISPARAIAMHTDLHDALEQVGQRIAETLASIKSTPRRVDLLRRNRATLGHSAATTLIRAIGRAVPESDAAQVRVGAVRDSRSA